MLAASIFFFFLEKPNYIEDFRTRPFCSARPNDVCTHGEHTHTRGRGRGSAPLGLATSSAQDASVNTRTRLNIYCVCSEAQAAVVFAGIGVLRSIHTIIMHTAPVHALNNINNVRLTFTRICVERAGNNRWRADEWQLWPRRTAYGLSARVAWCTVSVERNEISLFRSIIIYVLSRLDLKLIPLKFVTTPDPLLNFFFKMLTSVIHVVFTSWLEHTALWEHVYVVVMVTKQKSVRTTQSTRDTVSV